MPPPPSATYQRLRHYIAERMRMSPIDQPLMLMELLERSSPAPARDVARRILVVDVTQIETYTKSPGDASEGPRYRENSWSPALPARRVENDLLTLPLAQRLEGFLADGDPVLDADAVLAVLHCGRDPKLWRQRSKL